MLSAAQMTPVSAAATRAQPSLKQMPVSYSSGVATRPGRALRILCYGDSMTVGFCRGGTSFEPYARALAEGISSLGSMACEALACGLSGLRADTMADGLVSHELVDVCGYRGKGLARILDERGPFDLVLIMAGTNDMGHYHAPARILRSLERLHGACRQRGVLSMALAPPPAPVRDAAGEAERLQIVGRLRCMAKAAESRMACIDPAELVSSSRPDFWDADGLHFSPLGSRTFGQKLAALVVRQLLPSLRPEVPAAPRHVTLPPPRRISQPAAVCRAPAWVLVKA